MKTKDKSKISQKIRQASWRVEQELGDGRDYEWLGNAILHHFEEVRNYLIEIEK